MGNKKSSEKIGLIDNKPKLKKLSKDIQLWAFIDYVNENAKSNDFDKIKFIERLINLYEINYESGCVITNIGVLWIDYLYKINGDKYPSKVNREMVMNIAIRHIEYYKIMESLKKEYSYQKWCEIYGYYFRVLYYMEKDMIAIPSYKIHFIMLCKTDTNIKFMFEYSDDVIDKAKADFKIAERFVHMDC